MVFFQPNPEFRPAEADISKKPPFTRHPLERLYSAWADKFVIKNLDLNVEGNKTEIYNKALTNHYSTMGSLIPMKRETILESYENRQDVLAENPSQLVSFSGLLNFIVNAGKKGLRNIHWTPMTEQCGPCSINYDYITQLETISEDIKKIADELNFGENSKFPEMNKKAGLVYENQSERLAKIYFEKGVTIEVVARVREIYFHDDFEIFGYDFERFRVKFAKE